jgi:hypothetical protein
VLFFVETLSLVESVGSEQPADLFLYFLPLLVLDVIFCHYFLVHPLERVEEREVVVLILDDDGAELQFRVAMC